jgi:hypothetical protein
MQEATISGQEQQSAEQQPEQQGMYQRGKYPSVIDTDDLVMEMGVQLTGNLNKEKLLDKLVNDIQILKTQVANAEKEKAETITRAEQSLKSNKLYENNNRALDVELLKVRKLLKKEKDLVVKVQVEVENITKEKNDLELQVSSLNEELKTQKIYLNQAQMFK